jgi:hypothetical protein
MVDIDRTVRLSHMALARAEAAAHHMLTSATVAELEDLIEVGQWVDSSVPELVTWQAQRVLHAKTGRWQREDH